MLDYRRSDWSSTSTYTVQHITPIASQAASSQASAISKLRSIDLELDGINNRDRTSDPSASTSQPTSGVRSKAELSEEDQRIVMAELSAYLADTSSWEGDTTVQILSFWHVRSSRPSFLIYALS